MTDHVNAGLRLIFVATALLMAPAQPLAAAERGGGLRQAPLVPPAGKKPGIRIAEPVGETSPGTPPRDFIAFTYRGARYVVTAGKWYVQRGDRMLPIAPPQGVLVPELPQGYSVRWLGGVPYFYADGLYYVWRERSRSYEALPAAPPAGDTGHRSDAQAMPVPDAGQERVQAP